MYPSKSDGRTLARRLPCTWRATPQFQPDLSCLAAAALLPLHYRWRQKPISFSSASEVRMRPSSNCDDSIRAPLKHSPGDSRFQEIR